MGIFQNLFQKAIPNVLLFHPEISGGRANSEYSNQTISTLLTCQKILAEQLAKLPLEVYNNSPEQGKAKHKKHNLYKILHTAPNGYQTSYIFVQQLVLWVLEYGNAYAKINRKLGRIENLELVHPSEIKGYKVRNGSLYFYRVDADDNDETLNNDDILHLKFMSSDGITGVNPVAALYSELSNIYQGKTTLNATYRNGLNIDKFISSDTANFNGKAAQEALENIKKEYASSINSRKVPVMPAGFKIMSIPSGSIQDAQILDSMNFAKKDIAALFGIPINMLNFEGGSYNSIEHNALNFKTNTLQPLARQIKQEFENKLLSDKELDAGVSIEFNLNALVETDMNTRINYLKSLHSMGVVSSNDIARLEGFETFDGGLPLHASAVRAFRIATSAA